MLMTKAEADKLEMYKDGNYRPGMYEEGPGIDNAHRSGGLTHSGTTNTLVFNPSTHTTSYPYPLTINTSHSVGIGTINPTTQLSVNGDMAIEGNIRFTSEGVERARLTSEGNLITFGPDGQQYVNGILEQLNPENYDREQLIQELRGLNGGYDTEPIPQKQQTGVDLQHLYNELNEVRFDREEPAEDARWRLEQTMASQLAEANERVAQKHLSLLDNIELGTLDNDVKIKMQMLAGIKTTQQRIQEMDDHIKRLRSEEAQPEVVHSSIWNKIKNTGRKLSSPFTNRLRKRTGASPRSVSARLEAVKQSQEQ
jgi:molecular chaperone GrpE (heat shock protein)